jgi:hypothetical protein
VYSRWLALTALSYAVLHHLGLLPDGSGAGPDDTRWTDWLDLAVPWLVLTPAALTLRADRAAGSTWWIFGAGALARTMMGRARPGMVGYPLAVAVGLTWASNAGGGNTELLVGFAPVVPTMLVLQAV